MPSRRAASRSTRNSSSRGPRGSCRTRCGWKAATVPRIRIAIHEGEPQAYAVDATGVAAQDPPPIPPPFRGREEQAACAVLNVEAIARRSLHLPLKGRSCAPGGGRGALLISADAHLARFL